MHKELVIHLKAQDAWLDYMDTFGDSRILIQDIYNLGYTHEEVEQLFRKAIDTKEIINKDLLEPNPSW